MSTPEPVPCATGGEKRPLPSRCIVLASVLSLSYDLRLLPVRYRPGRAETGAGESLPGSAERACRAGPSRPGSTFDGRSLQPNHVNNAGKHRHGKACNYLKAGIPDGMGPWGVEGSRAVRWLRLVRQLLGAQRSFQMKQCGF